MYVISDRLRSGLRMLALIAGTAVAGGAVAGPAGAVLQPVPTPGSLQDLAVLDGNRWIASTSSSGSGSMPVFVTTSRGASWVPVTGIVGNGQTLVAAAPGAGYRSATMEFGPALGARAVQVRTIDVAGASAALGPKVTLPAGMASSLVVDEQGTAWVGWNATSLDADSGLWGLIAVSPDGTVREYAGPSLGAVVLQSVVVARTDGGIRARPTLPTTPAPGAAAAPRPPAFRVVDGALQAAEPDIPLYRTGALVVGSGSISFDGGEHWLANQAMFSALGILGVIEGAPGQAPATGLYADGSLLVPHGDRLLTESPLKVDTSVESLGGVSSFDSGLVIWRASSIQVHDGGLLGWPASFGALGADTQAMLARANLLRADAGLPPLIGDELISRASRGHAEWLRLNNTIGHFQEPGTPGFTGREPSDRCVAAGTGCGGEVVHSIPGPVGSVDGWAITPYHRGLPLGPGSSRVVGAAASTRAAVMNGGGRARTRLIGPVGFPNGRWRGALEWSGSETPDPVAACRSRGQTVTPNLGVTVTLYAPRDPQMVSVRPVGGAPMKGCLLGEHFLPDDPMRAGTTYEATGTWQVGDAARATYVWRFTAQPDGENDPAGAGNGTTRDRVRPTISRAKLSRTHLRSTRRKARSTRLSYRLSERSVVSVRVQRAAGGRKVGRACRTATRKNRKRPACTRWINRSSSTKSRKAGTVRQTIDARSWKPGRYRLRLQAQDAEGNKSVVRYLRLRVTRR